MTFEQLKEKALSLPYAPGVYIMRDKADKVIYVGKAKKLKNRVSQYFHDASQHSPKTRLMVSHIHQFDVIVAASEFEALVLECSLIKRHLPKYNILLKDDKGYPYLRLDMRQEYPVITMVSKIMDDGAEYFGPYGSRSITQSVLEAIRSTLKLPGCSRQFPRDLGKGRTCLNYHMNLCTGWCQGGQTEEYRRRMEQARQLLLGNYAAAAREIRTQMLEASERLEFELAAGLRDRLNAVEALGQKQFVTAGNMVDTDAVGFSVTNSKACFAVLHFSGGNLLDKDYEILSTVDDQQETLSSLVMQYYVNRGIIPKRILLPFDFEDRELLQQLFSEHLGRKCSLLVPQRGDNAHMVDLARTNAEEEAQRLTDKEEKNTANLTMLGKMLQIPTPLRMESFDISHIAGTDIVASMVVFENGKPKKGDYKRFQIRDLSQQDDYASMEQVVRRRLRRYLDGDPGFSELPGLMLIDGGATHANVARSVLQEMEISVPVFGMVKDDRHRTRALVSPDGMEIAIDANQGVYALIGAIQEETHRFAISYHRKLRSKRLRYSALDEIPGIGPKRKQELLKTFHSVKAISQATREELERLLPVTAAAAVYSHFHKEDLV